jgi:hypothetical protein
MALNDMFNMQYDPNQGTGFNVPNNYDWNTDVDVNTEPLQNQFVQQSQQPSSFGTQDVPMYGSSQGHNYFRQGEYDNVFRGASIGLSGLGIGLNVMDANRAARQQSDALKQLDASMDPNVGYYQSELKNMMSNPNGYLTDVATQNQVNSARQAMLQNARRQGRGNLSSDELRQLQVLASGAYQNRINTLRNLVGGNDTLKAKRAEIAAKPTGYNMASAIPHLADIFATGRDYAVSQGRASPRTFTPQQAQMLVQAASQNPNAARFIVQGPQ